MEWPSRDLYSSGNCLNCRFCLTSDVLPHVGLGGFPAGDEDSRAHIAAGLGRFVVLLGQHPTDRADDGVAAGKIPTTSARRRIFLLSRSCLLLLKIAARPRGGKDVNARMSSRAWFDWAARL